MHGADPGEGGGTALPRDELLEPNRSKDSIENFSVGVDADETFRSAEVDQQAEHVAATNRHEILATDSGGKCYGGNEVGVQFILLL